MPRAKTARSYPQEFFTILEQVGEQGQSLTVPVESRIMGLKLAGKYWAFRQALQNSVRQLDAAKKAVAEETKRLGKPVTEVHPELYREAELSAIADRVICETGEASVTFCRSEDTWQSKILRAALAGGLNKNAVKGPDEAEASLARLQAKLRG